MLRPRATALGQPSWGAARAGLSKADVRIHDLRHTFASFGVNNGQSLSVVGKLLGHSKIMTTQRYAHLADDPIRQASELRSPEGGSC